jgi:hypothetical protein
MSHIFVRQTIGRKNKFAGRDWWYEFRCFTNIFSEKSVEKYSLDTLHQFSKFTTEWTNELNSEWLCRIYLSAKMVLSASLMLNSLKYAESKNIRISSTYLEYYAIQSTLRAVLFTSPFTEWRNGDLVKLQHKTSINIVCDTIAKLDKNFAKCLKKHILHLKAYRELISYRAPSSGDSFSEDKFKLDLITLCQLLSEIAQVHSELMEASLLKHATEISCTFLDEYIEQVCHIEIDGHSFWDDEDQYRLDYLRRKHPWPTNIMHIMSEGHVEDYFGAWLPKDDKENVDSDIFNPDKNWGVIFNVP